LCVIKEGFYQIAKRIITLKYILSIWLWMKR
jgi:hypothetical protein